MLRNADQVKLDKFIIERQVIERSFFEQELSWNILDKNKVRIDFFRSRLQEILANHIRREFLKIRSLVDHIRNDAHQTDESRNQ